MIRCQICELPGSPTCADCVAVRELSERYTHDELILVVDAGVTMARRFGKMQPAGVGMVLATAHDEAVIATCAFPTRARTSSDAEMLAMERGWAWARVNTVWSDAETVLHKVRMRGVEARFIPETLRDPLHNLAHRLAHAAMKRDQARLDRIWVPGAVW